MIEPEPQSNPDILRMGRRDALKALAGGVWSVGRTPSIAAYLLSHFIDTVAAADPPPPLTILRGIPEAPPPPNIIINVDQAFLNQAAAWGIQENPDEQRLWADFWANNPFSLQYGPIANENDLLTRTARYCTSLFEVWKNSANPVYSSDYEIQNKYRTARLLNFDWKPRINDLLESNILLFDGQVVDYGLGFTIRIDATALSQRAASLLPTFQFTHALTVIDNLENLYSQTPSNLTAAERYRMVNQAYANPLVKSVIQAREFGQESKGLIISMGHGLQVGDEPLTKSRAFSFVTFGADENNPDWINWVRVNTP